VALDGTDEAEMICFGDIARRIIGKPVQQLLRTATSSNAYPGDIARLVSLKFTFAVTLTQQSYYRA
jgi:replication factor A1